MKFKSDVLCVCAGVVAVLILDIVLEHDDLLIELKFQIMYCVGTWSLLEVCSISCRY
jgi:hypothetical protein